MNRRPKTADTLQKDTSNHDSSSNAKKPPSGSDSGSCGGSQTRRALGTSSSSSSLARLVATSAFDMYEKYSPAHYKPNTELSGSRTGLNEAETDATTTNNIPTSLERPRSRYSRLYSQTENNELDIVKSSLKHAATNSEAKPISSPTDRFKSSTALEKSGSSEDVPTATFTLRGSRTRKSNKLSVNGQEKQSIRNGAIDVVDSDNDTSTSASFSVGNGSVETVSYVKLNKLKISDPKENDVDNLLSRSHSNSKLKSAATEDSSEDQYNEDMKTTKVISLRRLRQF